MAEKDSPKKPNMSNSNVNNSNNKKKKKKKRGGSKRKMSYEETVAYKSVCEWVFMEQSSSPSSSSSSSSAPAAAVAVAEVNDDFGVHWKQPKEKLVFEFHSHTLHSDGFLSPTKLVERAHQNGVRVLALTDHDTLSGIPEALEAASRFGMKIIPGVEVSTVFSPREESGSEEPVHILAYYGICGPSKIEELEKFLMNIRDGRFLRAKSMVKKLNKLKLPLKWEHVTNIAGKDVAPGRLHVARALVEAGHVSNVKQAFARYLYDGGPAYSTGSEPYTEEAVKLICETGGVAVLAHPWALKNPVPIIKRLKEAGLHGIEAYRSDGKLAVYSDLADTYDLVKLGGSDFHGRRGQCESDLGSVTLPLSSVYDFLRVARPIWHNATRDVLGSYVKDPSPQNLPFIIKLEKKRLYKSAAAASLLSINELISHCLSSWLTKEERSNLELETINLKLSSVSVNHGVALLTPEIPEL